MIRRQVLIKMVYFVIFSLFTGLSAHDLWLVPQKFKIKPEESIIVSANTGMDFPVSLSAIAPDRIDEFFILGRDERKKIRSFKVEGNSLIAELSFEKEGTYVLCASLKSKEIRLSAQDFNHYLLHEGLSKIYNLRKKENILDKDAVEHYSKFPKTIIQVGEKMDETPTKPTDLTLEIIPKENPYKLKKGDYLEIIVLYRGKPLADAELAWSYPGRGEEFAGSIKTDEFGKAKIPLEHSGPYVIRMIHMEWVKKTSHEWESYWTSLTFKVFEEISK